MASDFATPLAMASHFQDFKLGIRWMIMRARFLVGNSAFAPRLECSPLLLR
jgi:hypothetical protein